ncbi:MAG: hypothetical protein D6775_16235 [Caldilineae bacterium]|nr:MAG: hypothetical protein D6775_16235 [Caldilineae bacterium]
MYSVEVFCMEEETCRILRETIENAARSQGKEIDLRVIPDPEALKSECGGSSPCIFVNGEQVHCGGIPDRETIEGWFTLDLPLPLRARILTLQKGERLFHMGETPAWFYWVIEGELQALRNTPSGSQLVMLRARSREFFAESSLLAESYACDGIAICETRVAAFPMDQVRQLIQKGGPVAWDFVAAITRQARVQCSRYERSRLRSAGDRIRHLLICEAGPEGWYEPSGTLADLASELALEPETLYRTLGQMEKQGLIERKKRRFRWIGTT